MGGAGKDAGTQLAAGIDAGMQRVVRDAAARGGDARDRFVKEFNDGGSGGDLGSGFWRRFEGATVGTLSRTGVLGGAALIAGLGTAVAASGAIGAGINAGIGAGIVGIGITAAAQSQRVKNEFADLAQDVKAELLDISGPFEDTLVNIADDARSTFQDLKPFLAETFADAAPAVDRFSESINRGIASLGDSFPEVGEGFNAVLDSLGARAPAIFGNIESAMRDLAATAEANADDFAAAVEVVSSAISGLAGVNRYLAESWDDSFWRGLISDLLGGEEATREYAGAASGAAEETRGVGEAASSAASSVGDLAAEFEQLTGAALNSDEAASRYQEALDRATESIKKNGQTLSIHTEKGRANRDALRDIAKAAQESLARMGEEGRTVGAIAKQYTTYRGQLIATARAAGHSRGEATRLADAWLGMPRSVRTKLEANVADLDTKIGRARQQLRDPNLTRTRRVKLEAKIDQLLAAKRRAQNEINSLQGRTVPITVAYSVTGRSIINGVPSVGAHDRAHGGVIGGITAFASGGVSGATSGSVALVGERGPEYVRLPYGSSVIPAGTTRSMLKSEREARKNAVGDLTVSRFGWMSGRRTSEFENALGSPEGVGSLVGSLNQWRSTIRQTTHGTTERRLLRDLDVAGRALIKNERLQTKVNDALEKAKDKLSDLRQSFSQLKDSVKSNILSFGSITGVAPDRADSAGGVIGHLGESLTKSRHFASALATLKKRGIDKNILADVANAGVEQGGRTADALLRASPDQIKQINSLQSQLRKAATQAGTTAADAMYGAGIKAAEGVVKGLERNRDRIERAMMRMAASLEKAIRKALGVKGRAHGGIIGAAANGGPRGALTLVGEQGPELVDLPFGSMVTPAGTTRAMMTAAAGGGGGGPMVLELRSGGTRLDDLLVEVLRNAIRARGGDVQVVLGQGR